MSVKENKNIQYCQCCGKLKKIVCKTCGKKKKPEEFHAGKKICKVCRSKYNQERYQKNKKEKVVPIIYHDASIDPESYFRFTLEPTAHEEVDDPQMDPCVDCIPLEGVCPNHG